MAKRTVLIVDPDVRALEEVESIVEGLGLNALRARTAEEAMERLGGADSVFLDLKSAELNGPQVLSDVRAHPSRSSMPVVICAAAGEKADVVHAMRAGCLDWIEKPATKAAISDALRRVAQETRRQAERAVTAAPNQRARVLVQEIISMIKTGSLGLPEMPTVVAELRRVLSDPHADSELVLRVLEKDTAIAGRILATANTAMFGGRGRVTDLKSAITRLGNRTIASIAHTAALRGMFSFRTPAFKQVFQKMWTGQLVSAYLAREMAIKLHDPDPDEVYLLALLHNAGEPFLLRIFAEIFSRHTHHVLSMEEVLSVIREWHPTFGAGLMRKWNMSDEFALCARHHHDGEHSAETYDERTRRLLYLLCAIDRLVEVRGPYFYPDSLSGPELEEALVVLNIPADRSAEWLDRVEVIAGDIEELMA